MNKKLIIFITIFIVLLFLIFTFYLLKTNNFNKTESTENFQEENFDTHSQENIQENEIIEPIKPITEETISTYSTPLKSKASGRLNNISITCNSLNNTIIKSGETFSFCNTLGPATSEKGYEKADVIQNGEIIQALGGGNCQVSSTLYNAALDANLEIVERHEHGRDVSYVPDGKDAAVSYGSLDLKIKNNFEYDLKIQLSSDDENVYASIIKLN